MPRYRFFVYITPETRERLTKAAARLKRSRSSIMREMLESGLVELESITNADLELPC